MAKVIKKTVEKYINGYFSKRYPIDKKLQPHFWEAVIMLCENIDSDVTSLIDETSPICYIIGKDVMSNRRECINVTSCLRIASYSYLHKSFIQ